MSGTSPLVAPLSQQHAPGAAFAPGAAGGPMGPPAQPHPSQPHIQVAPAPYAHAQPAPATYDEPIGVPGLDGGRPHWLIPVLVGVAALVVGGGIAIVLAR